MPNSTDIVAELGRRLRDTSNVAYPAAMLNRLIDQCQRVLNCNQRLVLKTVDFTTTARCVLYQSSLIAPDIARVEMVRHNVRNLFDVPWESLVHQDRLWLKARGQRADYFSRIGNDILVIAPALAMPITVQVVYTTVTPAPTGVPADVLIPDENVPMLRDMIEAVALLRSRKFAEAENPVTRIKSMLTSMGYESIEGTSGQG